MTLCNHTLDQVWIWSRGINSSFSIVVARDEEGGRETIGFESVEELTCELCWSIVIGECYDVVLDAVVDV